MVAGLCLSILENIYLFILIFSQAFLLLFLSYRSFTYPEYYGFIRYVICNYILPFSGLLNNVYFYFLKLVGVILVCFVLSWTIHPYGKEMVLVDLTHETQQIILYSDNALGFLKMIVKQCSVLLGITFLSIVVNKSKYNC